jgi:hypothetical protein
MHMDPYSTVEPRQSELTYSTTKYRNLQELQM